jgi:HK97 family phage major capsid protein
MTNEPLDRELEAMAVQMDQMRRRELYCLQDSQRRRRHKGDGPLSLSRAITSMAIGELAGSDRTYAEMVSEMSSQPFNPQVLPVLWRDLTASGNEQLLAGTRPVTPELALKPFSPLLRLGVRTIDGLIADTQVPRETQTVSVTWFDSEAPTVNTSQSVLSQPPQDAPLRPKIAGIVTNISRQLLKQSAADQMVKRVLLNAAAKAVDAALLNGTGQNGQPLGILNTTGLESESGAALNAATLTMLRKVSAANANDDRIAFLSTPVVRALLQGRERAAGSGFVWHDNQIAGKPAHVSSLMTAGTMLVGDFSNVLIGFFGPGVSIEINPFHGFAAGVVQLRVLLSMDVVTLHTSAFCKATSIS